MRKFCAMLQLFPVKASVLTFICIHLTSPRHSVTDLQSCTEVSLCICIFLKNFIYLFIYLFYFTILYWFCHTSTWIHHGCTCVPNPGPPFPPPSPYHPSGSSQCTSPEHPVSCIKPGLVILFTYDSLHVSVSFSYITPPSPSPTEFKRLFNTSVSLLLFCI